MTSNAARLVVGLSGVSCGGKTTVTKLLHAAFPWASVLHQDAYFHPNDSKHHVFMPDLKHHNWELKSALDFPQMEIDVQRILSRVQENGSGCSSKVLAMKNATKFFENDEFVNNHRLKPNYVESLQKFSNVQLVILEGHIIFQHEPFYKLCDLRYFFTLDEAECKDRRRFRVYDPPNPPGFFDKCVWPSYMKRFMDVQKLPGINYIDAKSIPLKGIYEIILSDIVAYLERLMEKSKLAY